MNVLVVESPAKAKTINKYLGSGYKVLASFGHIRDLPSKDGSVKPDEDFSMIWEVDARAQKRIKDIADALKGADKLILATDPDREGEAISWHVLEVLKQKRALGTAPRSSGSSSTPSRAPPCSMPSPIRARSTKSWSTPIWRAARSTISWASRFRRCCGANCPARVRRAACNRWRCVLSASAKTRSKRSRRRNTGPSTPNCARRRARFGAHLTHLDGKKLDKLGLKSEADAQARGRCRSRRRSFKVGQRRDEAGQAPSLAAFHHLDAAAGSLAQAGLRRQAHHADRAAALRRRRHRRRNGRPDHLYAYRRRDDGRRSHRRSPQHRSASATATATCPAFRAPIRARPRTRRKRMKRSAPPASTALPDQMARYLDAGSRRGSTN